MTLDGGTTLLANLAVFGRLLRIEGAAVGPDRLIAATRALAAVDLADGEDVYWALRCSLACGPRESAAFDRVFAAFFAAVQPGPREAEQAPAIRVDEREDETGAGVATGDGSPGDLDPDGVGAVGRQSASSEERLRCLDFSEYGSAEYREAFEYLRRIALRFPCRRSGRRNPLATHRRIDLRRTGKLALRRGGEPLERLWHGDRTVPRRLVFLVDVSRSMEAYARGFLVMLQALMSRGARLEAFAFGTRLTRLTPYLEGGSAERAFGRATRAIPDWGGGTRIGENLTEFNRAWGGSALARGAVITVMSDGWECGEVSELEMAMKRLRRTAYRSVWVNPLKGHVGYEPLAAGMASALPHVDHFLAGHDLRSLGELVGLLGDLRLRAGGSGAATARELAA